MNFKHSFVALSILSALSLSGCGDNSSSSSSSSDTATTSSYSGTVNKGIVSNGKVEICEDFDVDGCIVDADGEHEGFYLETTTDESGHYDVVGAPIDSTLLVKVSDADSGETTMKCDVENCSTGVSFGDTFTVDSSWTLQAIVPSVSTGTSTVNVTSLTDVAALEAIEVADGGEITEDIATNANNAVQVAFGLTKSITEIGAVDLTDADAVADAIENDSEGLQAATYSATLLNVSEEDKKALLTFNNSTGAYAVSADTTTDVESLLTDASELLNTVETELTTQGAPISVSAIQGAIDAVDVPTEIASVSVSDDVTTAKAFITNVRTAYNAVQDGGDLRTGLEDFSDEFQDIDELVSDDLDTVTENMSWAVESIRDAYEEAEDSEKSFKADYFTVLIDGDTYSIDGTGIDGGDVKIEATISYPSNETSCTTLSGDECEASLSNVTMNITTFEIKKNDVTLTATGNASIVNLKDEEINIVNSYNNNTTIDSLDISLDSVLSYRSKNGEEVKTFTGDLTFNLVGFEVNDSSTYENNFTDTEDEFGEGTLEQGSETQIVSNTAAETSFTLNGTLSSNESSVSVYLNLNADNSLGYVNTNTVSDIWKRINYNNGGHERTEETIEDNTSETDKLFITASAIARIETVLTAANADGSDLDASIELNVTRNKYDVADSTITIKYNDVATILEADIGLYDTKNSDLVVRNATGVVATINALADDETLAGTLTVNGVDAATIEEADNGAVLVRYSNGTFESLF